MKKYQVKIQRVIELEIEAHNGADAEKIARAIAKEIPNSRLMSIIAEDAAMEVQCPVCHDEGPLRGPDGGGGNGSKPSGGGTPGTPVVRVEQLVDQVAKAA